MKLFIAPQREYSEGLETGHPQVGLKVQVHSPSELPNIENRGIAVGTGQHAYIGFTLSEVENMEPPWGACNKSLRLKYANRYSFNQCAKECKLNAVVEECGCKPFYFPGTIN